MSVIILSNNTVIGPFTQIETLSDRLRADGTDYPFVVIGDYEISDDDSLAPPKPAPPEPVPTTVSMRQARLQLLATNDLTTVDAAVSNMGQAAQIEWEYAATVERSNPLVAGIQALLQWTDEQLDTYFREAAKL